MNRQLQKKHQKGKRRSQRVRKNLKGTPQRPRLSVVKTNKHIIAQLIDDENGVTLGAVSTLSASLKGTEQGKRNKDSAKKVGEMIADIANDQNIKEIIFDRGRFKYHGILAELADAVREKGLKF